MSAPIVTPLTYGDALEMAEAAIGRTATGINGAVAVRDRVARALMTVDVASREQSCAPKLLTALAGCAEWMTAWHAMTLADMAGDTEHGMVRMNSTAFAVRLLAARAAIEQAEGR